MSDASLPPFVMHGARDAMAAGLDHIAEQVNGIEQAVTGNPGLAFDLAKTLIESVCRTVLTERGIEYAPKDDLPSLFRLTRQNLSFLPPAASEASEARRSLEQTLSGLNTALQGICELRNHCGFASHGSGAPRPALESAQALLAAEAADAIVGFLYRIHRQGRTIAATGNGSTKRDGAFDEVLDEEVGPITIRQIQLQASDVLFTMEPETYRIYLAEHFDES